MWKVDKKRQNLKHFDTALELADRVENRPRKSQLVFLGVRKQLPELDGPAGKEDEGEGEDIERVGEEVEEKGGVGKGGEKVTIAKGEDRERFLTG